MAINSHGCNMESEAESVNQYHESLGRRYALIYYDTLQDQYLTSESVRTNESEISTDSLYLFHTAVTTGVAGDLI